MFKSRSAITGFLFVAVILSTVASRPVAAVQVEDQAPSILGPVEITLAAGHSTVSWDERALERGQFELPLVYLHREQEAALESDRTLEVQLVGVPAGGEIQLEAVSRHVNVISGEPHRETKRAQLPGRPCTTADPCTITWILDAETILSDFYTLRVQDEAGALLWENPHADRPDFVALDTWDVRIEEYTARVTYATLFPFARGQEPRLSPAAVHDLIGQRFVPAIAETWQTQFNDWGFAPIHPNWDADKVVEVLFTTPPYALFGGTGIYTASHNADGSPYPERRLWWFSSSPAYDSYDSLENGYRALFAHEFYHMVQWNSLLSAGCSTQMWSNMVIEAQAKMVPSVQYPEIEILGGHVAGVGSEYQSAARHFFAKRLNAAYADLEADTSHRYDWAPYWRFLYEQTGSMGVLRAALEEMSCRYDPDVEAALPAVMDAALARSGGPFETFEGSQIAFAEANYALRLENGRCEDESLTECAATYYDPNHTYKAPALEAELPYSGSPLAYGGSVPARFGMDFVEIHLDRTLAGQPLRIAFQGEGRFSVQIWKLGSSGSSAGTQMLALASNTASKSEQPRALSQHPTAMEQGEDGLYVEWIPSLDPIRNNRLALIIVRLDAGRGTGATGDYTITLGSTL